MKIIGNYYSTGPVGARGGKIPVILRGEINFDEIPNEVLDGNPVHSTTSNGLPDFTINYYSDQDRFPDSFLKEQVN